MTISKADLETKYASWFSSLKNSGKAKEEILSRFSTEPDELHVWTEQDIFEQSRRIIETYEKAERSLNRDSAPNPGV